MEALKVDISLLNHHCTPTDWLADWLTYWGTSIPKALKEVGHSNIWGTNGTRNRNRNRALEEHLGSRELKELVTWTLEGLGHSRHLGTWGTLALEGHLGNRDTLFRGPQLAG